MNYKFILLIGFLSFLLASATFFRQNHHDGQDGDHDGQDHDDEGHHGGDPNDESHHGGEHDDEDHHDGGHHGEHDEEHDNGTDNQSDLIDDDPMWNASNITEKAKKVCDAFMKDCGREVDNDDTLNHDEKAYLHQVCNNFGGNADECPTVISGHEDCFEDCRKDCQAEDNFEDWAECVDSCGECLPPPPQPPSTIIQDSIIIECYHQAQTNEDFEKCQEIYEEEEQVSAAVGDIQSCVSDCVHDYLEHNRTLPVCLQSCGNNSYNHSDWNETDNNGTDDNNGSDYDNNGSDHEGDNDTDGDNGTDGDNSTDNGTDGDNGTDNGADNGTDGDNGTDNGADNGTDGDNGTDNGADNGADGDNGTDNGADNETNPEEPQPVRRRTVNRKTRKVAISRRQRIQQRRAARQH